MLNSYLSRNYASSFVTVFLPLFAIASLILFISMASITAYIEVNLSQMLFIYGYSLPEVLFFTLPVAFVVSVGVTLNRLSNDYELIVLFSSGITPLFIMRKLSVIAVTMSLILLTLSLLVAPQTKQINDSFTTQQAASAKLNIKPSELGQSFGNFFVYVASEGKEGTFNDVVVFQVDGDDEQIFRSNSAKLTTGTADTNFKMIDGIGYTYSQSSIERVDFGNMVLYQSSLSDVDEFISIKDYWKDIGSNSSKMVDFKHAIYISLMPLFTLFAIAAFTIIHPRYQKSRLFATLFVTTVSYLVMMDFLANNANFMQAFFAFSLYLFLSVYLFKKRVMRYF